MGNSKRVPAICPDCGKTFWKEARQIRCHECGENKNRYLAMKSAAAKKNVLRTKNCKQCGEPFPYCRKEYCEKCSTPEAVRARKNEMKRLRKKKKHVEETEAQKEQRHMSKYERLVADLVSGSREPRDNHEAIIRIEALGRIHGGMNGSYGKEAAGYYREVGK